MKWNMIVSTVVLGLGLCAPSYGYDLLDRMLGAGGCGCETKCCEPVGCCDKGPSCCAAPSCCDAGPSCCEKRCHRRGGGLFSGLGCCAKASCGCEAPSCCDKAPTCCNAAPACGCEAPSCCEPACKPRCRPCLLERLFACRRSCNSCCETSCATSCGCDAGCSMGGIGGEKGAPAPALEGNEMAPMPPAPVVDPSAYLPAKRRVVHASTTLVR